MTIPHRFVLRGCALALVGALPLAAAAQTSAPPSTQAAVSPRPPDSAPPVTTETQASSLESQGFTWDPAGRRDPFVSLVHRAEDVQKMPTGSRAAGLAGLETSEVTLKGTVASPVGWVGIVLGADSRTYIVRPGDRLLDGTIRAISQDSLVVAQQVNDPLSLEKQREVRKALRQTEEGK